MRKYVGHVFSNIYIILLMSVSVFVYLPTLGIKFSWIDDGWDIFVSKNILQAIINFNIPELLVNMFEIDSGRLRPVYWLIQTFIYSLGGSDAHVHFFIHYLILMFVVVLIYKLIYFFTKSKYSSFVGSFTYMLLPINAENWVRLGPQEPFMILFVLLSLYFFIVKGYTKISIFLMVFAFLTKETAIAVVPAIIAYYFLKKILYKDIGKEEIKYVISISLLALLFVFINKINMKGYSEFYSFDLSVVRSNYLIYINRIQNSFTLSSLFFYTFILGNLRPLVNFQFKKIQHLEIVKLFFLLVLVFYIFIQSPWIWVLDRYLLPATVFGCIFVGLEHHTVSRFLRNYKIIYRFVSFAFMLYLLIFAITSYFKINQQIVIQQHSTQLIYGINQKIAEVSRTHKNIYINTIDNAATYEPLFEIDIHQKLFFDNVSGIQIDFLENLDNTSGDYVVISSSIAPLGSYKYKDDVELSSTKKNYGSENFVLVNKFIVLNEPGTIFRQTIKKMIDYVKNGDKIDGSGIYTDYLLKDNWNIYYY